MQGYLQDTKVVGGPYGYLHQCPHLQTSCPTCGQFRQDIANNPLFPLFLGVRWCRWFRIFPPFSSPRRTCRRIFPPFFCFSWSMCIVADFPAISFTSVVARTVEFSRHLFCFWWSTKLIVADFPAIFLAPVDARVDPAFSRHFLLIWTMFSLAGRWRRRCRACWTRCASWPAGCRHQSPGSQRLRQVFSFNPRYETFPSRDWKRDCRDCFEQYPIFMVVFYHTCCCWVPFSLFSVLSPPPALSCPSIIHMPITTGGDMKTSHRYFHCPFRQPANFIIIFIGLEYFGPCKVYISASCILGQYTLWSKCL